MSHNASQNPFAERTQENPTGALRREAVVRVVRDDAVDAPVDAPLTLEIALSSEAPVERYDWMTGERYVEVLDHSTKGIDLSYAADGLPFCCDHDLDEQIGLVENLTVDGDRVLRGTVRRGNHPDASWLFADMAAGIRKKVSIGYWPGERYTQTKDKAGAITRRYTGWTLYECSSVTVPADYAVGVGRSVASRDQGAALAGDSALSTESKMSEQTTSERGTAPAPDTRAAELAVLARDGGMPEKAAEWIVGGTTVEAARSEVIQALRKQQAAPMAAAAPTVEVGKDRAEDKPWAPGEFFRGVIAASKNGGTTNDPRLMAARNQDTLIGEEGGFAVPMAVANVMLEATLTGGELLSRVTQRPITVGNSYSETVVKEEARTNGSRNGGVRHYWIAENGDYTDSTAATRQVESKLAKLGALVRLTEEQMQDGPAMESFLNEQVPEELRFGAEAAIWEGDGVAKPLGLMASGALVTQAIEGSQTILNTAGNIWTNAAKMYARMPARMLPGAAWFINAELWAKILTSTAGTGASAPPAFIAPGALNGSPNATLYGKPIIPIEYASTEGTVGDFVFANLSDYLFITKGGMRQQSSIHVDFIRDRTALKFTLRVNGLPRTRVPVTPFKGSVTQSPYIALAARS
jgi:HK97 family phage major capsid protein